MHACMSAMNNAMNVLGCTERYIVSANIILLFLQSEHLTKTLTVVYKYAILCGGQLR